MTMKKLLYIFAAVAALSAVSCVKENFNAPEDGVTTTFYGKALDVKTTVLDGHTVWEATDNIKVFYNETSVEAELKTGENTSSATFEAAVGTATDYYAVYPSSAAATLTGGVMTVTLPATQNGLFGAGHIAVAKAVDKIFTFTNVNSFLKMTLANAKYTRVVVESVGGEALSGDLTVTFADGAAVIDAAYANTSSTVEVTSETAFAAGDLYISVLPDVTHTKGLLVYCYNGEERVGTYFVDKEIITEASVIHTFGEFEPSGNYYVTAEGAGNNNGLSFANAMSVPQMLALIEKVSTNDATKIAVDGAVFNFAAGEYELASDMLEIAYDEIEPVNLTFKASGDVAFSGNDSHSIMSIKGAHVTLDGIRVIKSVAKESFTGAIKVSGTNSKLTLKGCSVVGNSADGYEITSSCFAVSDGALLTATDCSFTGNSAYSAPVLYVNGASVNMTNCRFENNEATENAGVVYVDGNAMPTFNNCVFTGNRALKWGMIHHQKGTTTFNECTFTDNTIDAGWDGGVLAACGGSSGTITINGGEMSGNHAGWGAAIYQDIMSDSKVATIYANDVLIKNNSNAVSGTVYANGETHLTRCVFDGNTADATTTDEANAIVVPKGGNMKMYGCTVQNHVANGESNTIIIRDNATLYIGADSNGKRTLIKGNSTKFGGAIRVAQRKDVTGTATLIAEATTFEGNNAQYGGAILACGPADINLYNNVTFKDNYSSNGNGGAILFESKGTLTCNNCHFENNYSKKAGGAIQVNNSGGKLYLNACTFKGNYQEEVSDGTTIQINNANQFAMNNCTIADDTYAKVNSDSEPTISWISFISPQTMWVSNNTFIGVPRYNGEATYGGLVSISLEEDTEAYFVNNIIVNDELENTWSFCQLDQSIERTNNPSVTLFHTKYTEFENASACEDAGYLTYQENPTSSGFSKNSFGSLTWNSDKCYWSWNGTMTGGANTDKITKDQFVSTLDSAELPEFKTWLEEINALDKDQLGNSRGSGDWWPGSYQGN